MAFQAKIEAKFCSIELGPSHALTALLFCINVFIAPDPSLWWLVLAVAMAAKTVSNVGWFINYVQG